MKTSDTSVPAFGSYAEAVDWITRRAPVHGIKPGLKRMQRFMELLEHPERRLKFIHVAGTNGKGSTCAYLTSVLQKSGYDVGTFTSPYLEKFTNRLRFNGKDIEEEQLLELANRLKPLADEIEATELGAPTMFEICTALAILYFAKMTYPDYVVWETGLGGEFDSTNIVSPVVTVITNVGHDHMDILGDSLVKVAKAKAGIIKAGVPVISAVDQPEVKEVIERTAREKKATLYLMNREYSYETVSSELNKQVFHFSGPFRQIADLPISMNGHHQMENAAVAVMTLEVLRQYYALLLEDEALTQGLYETHWPGRLEMISDQPRILLDGAHNPEGAATLAAALKETYRYDRLRLMIGMLSTKDHSGFLTHILPLVNTLVITEPDFHKGLPAAKLAEQVEQLRSQLNDRVEIFVEPDWKKALKLLGGLTGPEDLAVVSGTLYLISDVRSWILYQSDSEKGW
ncbi:folylpolyglutamate synthase/dihydrofolate synthase family protein [Paenibacillus aurantius]|uniref:Dihydrofolate synthase/folylpolyglutamate synthase n=1 Tax=Paenibacillus aurantius TaxID=2918900 RepID=A0AA96RG72_9BACL|nr:folylpolyglutamate synthase/dihydrofolate synthase family protein [Paenibacillus aurantius]WNQ14185.1 folylpolyglutamate synthase/dihydrofolate synthase family protein [Paenibacillus aurantius]